MTIYATLFFPMSYLGLEAAADAGWQRGPFGSGRSRFQMPSLETRRTQFYVNSSPLEDLLAPDNRAHALLSKSTLGSWKVSAAELVRARSLAVGAEPGVQGYLIVHLAQTETSRELSALTQLGELVPPDRKASSSLLDMIAESTGLGAPPWARSASPRVFALSLSDTPAEGDVGSVRWAGSSPEERRLAGLTALPPKSSIQVTSAFDTLTVRPTPSFELVVGRWTAAALRTRVGIRSAEPEPLAKGHVVRLRTSWTDTVLLELTQRDALTTMIRTVGSVRLAGDGRRWRNLAQEFNGWQSDWALRTTTDHPLESALAIRLRHELGTQELMDLLSDRISTHAEGEAAEASERLASVVTALTLVAALLPIILVLATPNWEDVLRTPGFLLGIAAFLAYLVWLVTRRFRSRKEGS